MKETHSNNNICMHPVFSTGHLSHSQTHVILGLLIVFKITSDLFGDLVMMNGKIPCNSANVTTMKQLIST